MLKDKDISEELHYSDVNSIHLPNSDFSIPSPKLKTLQMDSVIEDKDLCTGSGSSFAFGSNSSQLFYVMQMLLIS